MQVRRLDDYQGWEIDHGGTALLVDPWLDAHPITGAFERRRTPGVATWSDVAADGVEVAGVLLCAPFNDHLRAETLRSRPNLAVYGNPASARAARAAGCASVSAHRVGEGFGVACRDGGALRVTATRCGLPLGLLANGWLIEATDPTGADAGRVWIEPHAPTVATAAEIARRGPLDVAIVPTHGVLAAVLPVTAGPGQTSAAVRACGPRRIVPTATDPRRDMSWWQRALYVVWGGESALAERLVDPTRLMGLQPGEHLDVRAVG